MNYKINIQWEKTNIPFTKHMPMNYKNKTFFFRTEEGIIYRKNGNYPILDSEPNNTIFNLSKNDDRNYTLESTGTHKDDYFDLEQKVLEKFNNMAFKAGMTKTELRFLSSCPPCFMYKYVTEKKVDLVFVSIPLIDDLYDLSNDAPIPLIDISKIKNDKLPRN